MVDAAERPPLEIAEILKTLDAHQVEYVIIGGVAGRLHADATLTYDLDITPEPGPENLDRLAAALEQMDVGLRAAGVDEPLPFALADRVVGGPRLAGVGEDPGVDGVGVGDVLQAGRQLLAALGAVVGQLGRSGTRGSICDSTHGNSRSAVFVHLASVPVGPRGRQD